MTDIQSNASFFRGYYHANITLDSHRTTHKFATSDTGETQGLVLLTNTDNIKKTQGEGHGKFNYSPVDNDNNSNLLTKTAEAFDQLSVVLKENKNSVLAYSNNVIDVAEKNKQLFDVTGRTADGAQATPQPAGLKPFSFNGDRLIAFHSAMGQLNSALAQGCFDREPAATSPDGRPHPAGKNGLNAALTAFSPQVLQLAGLLDDPAVVASTAADSEDVSSADALAKTYSSLSYREAWELMAKRIEGVKTGYLEVYETLVERYTGLFSDFSDFMGKLTTYLKVTPDKNGNQVMTFEAGALDEVNALIKKYSGDQGNLYPVSGTTSQADALAWAKELGIDTKFVVKSGSGYVIKMDLGPLNNIRDSLAPDLVKSMSTFEYQSWRSGFDAQSDRMKTTLQTLTSKYGSANSTYETVIKLLSSMISSMSDVLKQIMANF